MIISGGMELIATTMTLLEGELVLRPHTVRLGGHFLKQFDHTAVVGNMYFEPGVGDEDHIGFHLGSQLSKL